MRERRWVTAGWDVPREFHVGVKVCRNVTALFLDIVHNIRLVHHIPLAVGDELLEVVREQLPTDIDSRHVFKNEISRDEMGFTFSQHSKRSIRK